MLSVHLAWVDTEARGDYYRRKHHAGRTIETVAQVGVQALPLHIDLSTKTVQLSLSDFQELECVLPTPLSDQEWRDQPLSSSSWWEDATTDRPRVLARLKAAGHVWIPDEEEYLERVTTVSTAFVGELGVKAPGTRVWLSDTSVADVERLNSVFAHGGKPALPVGDNLRYNHEPFVDVDRLWNHGRDVLTKDQWNAVQFGWSQITVPHDHDARNDAKRDALRTLMYFDVALGRDARKWVRTLDLQSALGLPDAWFGDDDDTVWFFGK